MNEATRRIVDQLATMRDSTLSALMDEAAAAKDWDLLDNLQTVYDSVHAAIGKIVHEANTGTGSAAAHQEG